MKIVLKIILLTLVNIQLLYAKVYIVSVVPQLTTTKIEETWSPFLKALSEKTGLEFQLRHYATIPQFENGLERGEPDIAFMNPYHAVMAYDWQKYVPMLHDEKLLVGILVVKKTSPIRSVNDLNGEDIAFPAPNAYAASLYMRALLNQEVGINFRPIYVKTHSNVYRSVIFGNAAAGGGVNNTLLHENNEVKSSLRVIYTTKGTAPHPLCIHPRVTKKEGEIIKQAILDLSKEPQYTMLLNNIQIPNPIEADYMKEYAPLKKLNLNKYVVDE